MCHGALTLVDTRVMPALLVGFVFDSLSSQQVPWRVGFPTQLKRTPVKHVITFQLLLPAQDAMLETPSTETMS